MAKLTDLEMYESVCKPRFDSQQKQLDRLEGIANENHAILKNGLKGKMASIEALIEKVMTPAPWWQKFLLKYAGTVIIIGSFILGIWLALRLLPEDVVVGIIEAVIK